MFENAKKETGPRDIGLIATRMAIVFTVIALGLASLLPDVLIFVSRNPAYHAAAPVIPVIVLAFLFQGFFLLSSIGISITKETRYYPMITAACAFLNVGLNFALIPSFGIMGSAWATVLGYALMALLGAAISHRLYPIPVHWPDSGNAVDQILRAAFPALQTAVTEFRDSLPICRRRKFDQAWFIYRLGSEGRKIDKQCYDQYMGFSSPDKVIPDSKVTFHVNVSRLLSFSRKP